MWTIDTRSRALDVEPSRDATVAAGGVLWRWRDATATVPAGWWTIAPYALKRLATWEDLRTYGNGYAYLAESEPVWLE